ncbi:hypothetical protein ACFQJD_00140 [Haloplanus sp. GCM10025708]|uniref:hypothetical protein n=1 Tax=Haloplanus sp. GCM10025708 TaxID=3252679 RepID=UPI0036138CBC
MASLPILSDDASAAASEEAANVDFMGEKVLQDLPAAPTICLTHGQLEFGVSDLERTGAFDVSIYPYQDGTDVALEFDDEGDYGKASFLGCMTPETAHRLGARLCAAAEKAWDEQ